MTTKYRLTTTLAMLKQHKACESGYRKLLKSLGARWPQDKPINLLRVLKSNGVQDMLWCLCATEQDCDKVELLIAADVAESVLKHFTKAYPNDHRPALAIKAARDFANGKIDKQARATARNAAWAAAWAAGDAWAARAAAWAAGDAARDAGAAGDAARNAGAAAWDAWAAGAAELNKQATIIRGWLR